MWVFSIEISLLALSNFHFQPITTKTPLTKQKKNAQTTLQINFKRTIIL